MEKKYQYAYEGDLAAKIILYISRQHVDGTKPGKDKVDVSLDDDSSEDWLGSRNDRGIHQDGPAVVCFGKDTPSRGGFPLQHIPLTATA